MDESLKTTYKPIYFIHAFITLLIMFGFGKIPPMEPLTQLGMQSIGIFLGMIYGWLTCSLVWPSIMGLILLGFTEYGNVAKSFATAFSNQTIILLIMIFGFLGIVQSAGISQWIGYKIISVKFAKGRPWVLTMMIWLTTIVLASVMGPVIPIVIVWEIVYTIADIAGYEKGQAWPGFAIAGVVVFSCIGGSLFPFTDYPLLVFGTYQALSGSSEPVNFISYLICTSSFITFIAIAYFLIVRFIFKPDVSKLQNTEIDLSHKVKKLDNYQKTVMAVLLVAILGFLLPSILPGGSLRSILSNIGVMGIAALCIALFALSGFPKVPDIGKIMGYVNWRIIFMLLGALTLATVLRDDASGFTDWASLIMTPLIEGKSGYALAVMVVVGALIMTQFANNNATSVILLTIAYSMLGDTSSVSMIGLTICIMVACSLALILPSGSAVSAMLFGNDWVPKKIVFTSGFVAMILGLIGCVLIVIPLSQILF